MSPRAQKAGARSLGPGGGVSLGESGFWGAVTEMFRQRGPAHGAVNMRKTCTRPLKGLKWLILLYVLLVQRSKDKKFPRIC